MNNEQFAKVKSGKGFIAALDQSGGSTPKALLLYGIEESEYSGDEQMYDLIHAMRTRIIKSSAFSGERVLGAILFEMTMDRKIDGKGSAEFLWEDKGVVPFLKIDKGLADEADVVFFQRRYFLTSLESRARNSPKTKLSSTIPSIGITSGTRSKGLMR